MKLERLVKYIVKEVVKQVNQMREASTTGGVAGYQTPYAFSKPSDKKRKSTYLKRLGYTPLKERERLNTSIQEEISQEDYKVIRKLIRVELSNVFFDLFKKRMIWINR